MNRQAVFLVFGATGQTGQHFVSLALNSGHKVKALVRNPAKLSIQNPQLEVHEGSITSVTKFDELLQGVDFVISMLGDIKMQKKAKINTEFVKRLIPAMRKQAVKRFLYQAGALSKPYRRQLTPVLWTIRNTIARGFAAQHEDNEAVIEYLEEEARDIEWMVHRAGIGSNGPSKGTLKRSNNRFSIGTFVDCAAYNYRTVQDVSAIHTCDFSHY